MKNLVNFDASSGKWIAYKVSAKKVQKIISHNAENRPKLGRKTDSLFENWHEEFDDL